MQDTSDSRRDFYSLEETFIPSIRVTGDTAPPTGYKKEQPLMYTSNKLLHYYNKFKIFSATLKDIVHPKYTNSHLVDALNQICIYK